MSIDQLADAFSQGGAGTDSVPLTDPEFTRIHQQSPTASHSWGSIRWMEHRVKANGS